MVLDVVIGRDSASFQIDSPFQADIESLCVEIERFASSKGTDISGLDVRGLIPRMIRGIAGCERGCPANAQGLVARGHDGFDIRYVEGGILTASRVCTGGASIALKMFPDF